MSARQKGFPVRYTLFMQKAVLILALALAASLLFAGAALCAEVAIYPKNPRQGDAAAVVVKGVGGEASIKALGREFTLYPYGGEMLGLMAVERDTKPGEHEVEIAAPGGKTLAKLKFRVEKRAFVEQHLKVDEKTVELSAEDLARADREKELINRALGARSPKTLWAGEFLRPVKGEVSSTFGLKRFYNGKGRSYHGGLDIAAPKGEPVKAAANGTVALAGDLFFTGNSVFVDHGHGLVTAYFHMDELFAGNGERVERGDILGKVGSTGRSTGPHLHWSVYVCGVKVDPESLNAALAKIPRKAEKP